MKIRKLAVLLAVLLVLGGSGLAFAAFTNAPAPADILTRAVSNLQAVQDGHAILQIQGTTPDKSGSATIEVWGKKLSSASNPTYEYRAVVNQASEAKEKGDIAVSDGKQFWFYSPAQNTVWTGSVAAMQNYTHTLALDSAQEIVQQILNVSTVTLAGTESVQGHSTYKLQLVPNSKAPAAAAGATGFVWIDQSSFLPVQGSVNGGSMGQGQVTAQTLELNAGVPANLFTFQVPAGAKVVQVQDLQPQHLTLSNASKAAGFTVLEPAFVPNGAKLVDVLKTGHTIVLRYESSQGSFAIAEGAEQRNGVPGTTGQSVSVRGTTGTLFVRDNTHVLLTWKEKGLTFSVSGVLTRDQALQVAESLH